MAAGATLSAVVDQLIELFNKRSMDLPDGFFTRNTQFVLNGVPFENTLGRPPDDPLVLMLARGPAGYRFIAKAVQHAVPDATLQRGELQEASEGDAQVLTGQCWISGHYRGAGELAELLIGVELRLRASIVLQARATVNPALLEQLQSARLRP
jgi:hypothetical protein